MRVHRVSAGETVRSIAERFGTTPQELQNLNELDSISTSTPGLHLLLPSSVAAIPQAQTNKRTIEVNGYLTPSGTADAKIVQEVGTDLTYLCVFSYQARADGSLQPQPDYTALSTARNLNVVPLVTITNFDGNNFNTQLAHSIMSDANVRGRLINNMIDVAQSKGYRGLNIDFEHMDPPDRPLYNRFIADVGEAARRNGLSISIAMGPKTSDAPQQQWMGAFDYKTLGAEVDFLMLMTYEWGWVGGPPMAIAPLNQVRAVLNYATSVIPPNKILMGMATYGYDWPLPYEKGKRATGISDNNAQNLAIRTESPIQWNEQWQSPFFRYRTSAGVEHEVWFDDASSALTKMQLVYELGLRGISYWVLGNSFPQNWYLLRDNFTIRKF